MIRWHTVSLMVVAIGLLQISPGFEIQSQVIAQQAPPSGPNDLGRTIKEVIATMNELAIALEGVHDDTSADAVCAKIESCGKKLKSLHKKVQQAGTSVSEEVHRKLGEKYENEIMAAVYRIKGATVQAVQRASKNARQVARTLADAGQLYASLDMFDVGEDVHPDGTRSNRLMTLDRTLIGVNFTHPVELRRLAMTYYHRRGPVGVVLERLNWFPSPVNMYWADARLPASLVALAAGDVLSARLMPVASLVGAWSEPPIGVIGLEVGTLASYGRPLQDLHFYDKSGDLKQLGAAH